MKAWELRAFGDPAGLAFVDRPPPMPGPGEVLVDITAVSLNYRDLAIARGRYAPDQPLPLIPASDAVGTIAAVGDGVIRWRVGDRVIGCYMQTWDRGPSRSSDRRHTLGSPLDGVLCEQRVFPQHGIVAAPAGLSDLACATLPIAALTAWCALFEQGAATPGETVLVQGSGGVSTFAVQLAAAAGLRVLATSRSSDKAARARGLGAAAALDTSVTPDWAGWVLDATDGAGADVVLDVVGGSGLRQSMRAAAQNGRIVSIGFLESTQAEIALPALMGKNLCLRGVTVGSRDSFERLIRFVDRAGIEPVIDSVFDFDRLPAALARLASGQQHGKVCIRIEETT